MTIAIFTIALVQDAGNRPADLVERLGSSQYGEREKAAAALVELGVQALPALRAATRSKDPEVRTRADSLLAKIEADTLTRGAVVRLDFADRPLDEVIKDERIWGPNRLAWASDVPRGPRQPTTIGEREPLSFWAALDRVCQAGNCRYIPGSPGGHGDGRPPQFRLFLAHGTSACPHADDGPLRLELLAIHDSRWISLAPSRPDDADLQIGRRGGPRPPYGAKTDDFHIELRLLAEPRLLMSRTGEARVLEMLDESGRSLLRPGTPGPRA